MDIKSGRIVQGGLKKMVFGKKAIVNSIISIVIIIVFLIALIVFCRPQIQNYYQYTDWCDSEYGEGNWKLHRTTYDDILVVGVSYICVEKEKRINIGDLLQWNFTN